MHSKDLYVIINHLKSLQEESEWVEFKINYDNPEEIGEYISALSNSAALHGHTRGYIVWGINDKSHQVIGTTFVPKKAKIGNQELESWLLNQLTPGIEVRFLEGVVDGFPVVVFVILAAFSHPVRFKGNAFIRVGTYKKNLKDYPEKERRLWEIFQNVAFEDGISKDSLSDEQVLQELDYISYFQLMQQVLPDNRSLVLQRLKAAGVIKEAVAGRYDITNLGAILFANDLEKFGHLGRKALRVVIYQGNNRVNTIKELLFKKGYAADFAKIIQYINDQLPRNEVIAEALRREVRVYPEIAIRELVANALIHQDFTLTGNSPMVEIFHDRIEITNPGHPLIDTLRFIDEPPRSRNESLARLLRQLNICEERGSGIDKVIFNIELFQLPPPDFRISEVSTIAVLFSPSQLAMMKKEDKIRACYQHACLQWVSGSQLSNTSLRKRLGISDSNYTMASRIIRDAIDGKLLKSCDDTKSKKTSRYVPFWA